MVTMPTRPGRPPVVMGYANWTPAGGADGAKPETVSAYSNCDEVELFLNGQSLGTKPKDPKDAPRQWQVPFAAGTLRAVAKNGGQVVASDELKTAAAPAKVVLKAERSTLKNDPEDVVYVRAFVTDADGTTNPNATHKLTVTSDGKVWGTFPVSLGASNTPTKRGVKVIMEKGKDISMRGPGYYDPHVKYTQRLTYGGEYLHAAPWNTYNITHGINSSNGCTNLFTKDAITLYNFLQVGDPVEYPDANGPQMSLGAGYGDWNVSWAAWQTGGAIPTQ